ncbi:hypothetical protein [Acinetobacter pseudolwoffii]|nr:hypothetical protein [Acinetobacter pseudolwoffii]
MPAHKGFNKVKMQSLKGKIAVITGASSGIGEATARLSTTAKKHFNQSI